MIMKMERDGFILVILILIAIYYFYNPETSFFFPKCPFKTVTGLDCPGCGSQRALHELLHFNIKKAFQYNALLIISIPYILVGLVLNFTRIKNRFPKTRKLLFGQRAIFIILSIIVLFFFLRNI